MTPRQNREKSEKIEKKETRVRLEKIEKIAKNRGRPCSPSRFFLDFWAFFGVFWGPDPLGPPKYPQKWPKTGKNIGYQRLPSTWFGQVSDVTTLDVAAWLGLRQDQGTSSSRAKVEPAMDTPRPE